MRRSTMVMGASGLAAALALWIGVDGDDVPVDAGIAGVDAHPGIRLRDELVPAAASLPTAPATITAAPSAPLSMPTPFAVPITVAVATKMAVGETTDLVFGVGAGAGEITFDVQLDPNVLQARSGTDGGWAAGAGANARFAAEIPEEGDRVRVRSAVSGLRAGRPAGTVAIVTLQAVGPGTTPVLITDVVVKDFAGRSMPSTISASSLQLTVSTAPIRPGAGRQQGVIASEPSLEITEVGD